MNPYLGLYLLTRIGNIKGFLIFLGVATGIMAAILFITWVTSVDTETSKSGYDNTLQSKTRNIIKKIWLSLIPISIVIWFFVTLIPTQKEFIFIIAGGKTLNWAVQDSNIAKIPSQSTQLMSDFLEQQIKSLTDDTKKGIVDVKDSVSKDIKNTVVKELLK